MRLLASITGLVALAASAGASSAQTAAPPWSAALGGRPAATAPAAVRDRHARAMQKAGKSADMDTRGSGAGVTPTGPYTTTEDAPPVSDLTGSVGGSVGAPAAPPPPGVAPPNGSAPDTAGAETPNAAGGPH